MEPEMTLDHDEIARLTEEYGGAWGINHTRRLLALIDVIGAGQSYDAEAVWLAAHLHDWGAYKPWAQAGVDHAVRSREVAEQFLAERGCPPALAERVLECIALHHSGGECATEPGIHPAQRRRRPGFPGRGRGPARFFQEPQGHAPGV